jgi:hypothetical protein
MFLQLAELLFYRGVEGPDFLNARFRNVAQVRVSDGIGDIRCDLGITVPIGDCQQICLGIMFDPEMFQFYGSVSDRPFLCCSVIQKPVVS